MRQKNLTPLFTIKKIKIKKFLTKKQIPSKKLLVNF
jgi:hypothetical protein